MKVDEIDAATIKHGTRHNTRISKIVIHDTAGLMPGCLNWLQISRPTPDDDVSVHLLVDKLGSVYRLVPDEYAAWHVRGHNSESLGLELERARDDEEGDYPYFQLEKAALCVAIWCRKFSVPLDQIYSHAELDPARRRDPRNFPWHDFLLRVADLIIKDRLGVV